jgi:HAD superfamily hydrolase (TIGR01509 family)
MSYQAIIFDFFDVIHRDPFHHWMKQHNLERTGEVGETSRLLDIGDIDDEEFYKRLGDFSGQPAASVKASFADTNFIDYEMLDIIKALKGNYKTGLLSNSSVEYIWDIIHQHGIEPLFDYITVSAEVRLVKPDPRIFEHILDKLNARADEAVFIDDNPKNVEAASSVGIKGLVYNGDISNLKKELSGLGIVI